MWAICGFSVCLSVTRFCWDIANTQLAKLSVNTKSPKISRKNLLVWVQLSCFTGGLKSPQFVISEQVPPDSQTPLCGFAFLPLHRQFAQDYTILFAWLYNLLFSNIPLKSKQHNRKTSSVSQLFQNPVSGMCKGRKVEKKIMFFWFCFEIFNPDLSREN